MKTFTRVILITLFCFAGVQAGLARIDQGAITGTVTDATGGVIHGASVTLVSQSTNLSFTRSTDEGGFYRFSPIKIGLYTLTVTATGFETRRASGSFNLQTSTGVVQGISNKTCRLLQRADGYNYSLIAHTPTKESENWGVLRTPRYPSPA